MTLESRTGNLPLKTWVSNWATPSALYSWRHCLVMTSCHHRSRQQSPVVLASARRIVVVVAAVVVARVVVEEVRVVAARKAVVVLGWRGRRLGVVVDVVGMVEDFEVVG